MSSEETKPVWRGRAIAVAGLSAALAGAGLVTTTSADAATPPTSTLKAPATILNTGATTPGITLEVNNSAAGNAAIAGTNTFTVTLPSSDIACSSVTLTNTTGVDTTDPDDTGTALTRGGTSPNCTFTEPIAVPAGGTNGNATGSDATFSYSIAINGAGAGTNTGNVSLKSVITSTTGGNTSTVATSNTTNSALQGGTAAAFTTSIPNRTVFQPYAIQAITTQPNPAATYTIYRSAAPGRSGGTFGPATAIGPASADPQTFGGSSGKDFTFTPATGMITANERDTTDAVPAAARDGFTILSNNGFQGNGQTRIDEVKPTTTTPGRPAINEHDVASPTFTLATLFSDVALDSTFAKPIYNLANSQSNDGPAVIAGNTDGTFRPLTPVNRQGFATFIARLINDSDQTGPGGSQNNIDTGRCDTSEPSAFSDVPNSSQFCAQIRDLSGEGIIKGNANGTFSPTASVDRQSIAAFLYRSDAYLRGAEVNDAPAPATAPFSDVPRTSPFAGDIKFTADRKIAAGNNGRFFPTANALRQENAAFLDRFATYENIDYPRLP